ncbi:ABC transporter permease subunit [candidate division KSB1 bacterium]|nr:ABC transporter permease subunit [candidate division KSB1 bacterium]
MLAILIQKELKAILLSPKFAATFATCAVLILLSLFIGIQDYRAAVRQYEAAQQLNAQEMREQTSWRVISSRVYRQPDPLQILVAGVNNDIGRLSLVNAMEAIKLRNSSYSDDPIFAVFRFIDFVFIVQVVLSLFAILFTFDAVNGEREGGTLKLVFSNAIPRAQYLLAKFLGSWFGLVLPLLIPILLGLLLIMVYRIPADGIFWLKVTALIGMSVLFFTFFIAFGVLLSSLTRSSSVSFLLALVLWVVLVLIIPRAGVMAAGQIVPVPSVAEIEGQQNGFEKASWDRLMNGMKERWRSRDAEMAGMSAEQREAYRDAHEWQWLEEEDQARQAMQKEISDFAIKLHEDLRNRKAQQERLGFALSRFSPASAYQLAAMQLAGTDVTLKSRYEDAMQNYRNTFSAFTEKKQKEAGGLGGIRITMDSQKGFSLSTGRDQGSLDLSELPRFQAPAHSFAEALAPTLIDWGLLALCTVGAFAGAFVVFLRYDVR